MKPTSSWWRWTLIAIAVLVLILGPFFLFEDDVNAIAARLTDPGLRGGFIAAAVIILLALDVVLPVPSSIVSTAAGATLGFAGGIAASAIGMSLGCLIGYVLGVRFGEPLIKRCVRERDLAQVSAKFQRGAGWALAILRPIPVLAEASALFAGVCRVPFAKYMLVTTLANIGISAAYARVGSRAFNGGSFLLAFLGSLALPGVALLANKLARRGAEAAR